MKLALFPPVVHIHNMEDKEMNMLRFMCPVILAYLDNHEKVLLFTFIIEVV